MLTLLRKIIPEDSFIRLAYSWGKAILAKLQYGNPSKDLIVIGVTGTDGKTTTTHFCAELLEQMGMKVAMASTEEIWIAGEHRNNTTKRTTLSPFITQKFLKEAKDKKCQVVILEVSSHALTQGRVFGVDFNGAVVTNISQEHGNYHKSLEEYASTKAQLFKMVKQSSKKEKVLIINKHMQFFELFADIAPELKKSYALDDESAYLTATNIRSDEHKNECSIYHPQDKKEYETVLNVAGSYNVENMLAAVNVAEFLGYNLEEIATKIPLLHGVAGRLEQIDNTKGLNIFVDFALTPGAFEKLLDYAQGISKGKVTIVFGCTGANHDHVKRPMMGSIAAAKADMTIITEDETYGEDNNKIMDDIEKGFPKNFKNFKRIPDRKEAIYFALENAKEGDTILITGMGAFTSRFNGKEEVTWSDKGCVENWLQHNNIYE